MEPGNANHDSCGLFIANGIFSLAMTGLGLLIDLYVYAFASMVDPKLNGGDYWRAVFRGMFLSGAAIPTLIGLILIAAGAWMAIASTGAGVGLLNAPRPIIRTWRVFLISILTLLGVGLIILLLL